MNFVLRFRLNLVIKFWDLYGAAIGDLIDAAYDGTDYDAVAVQQLLQHYREKYPEMFVGHYAMVDDFKGVLDRAARVSDN